MGVDYFTCELCGNTFPDCGSFGYCICENILCDYCVDAEKNKYGTVETSNYGECSNGCDACKLVTPSDAAVLKYTLALLGRKRKDVEDEMRSAAKEKDAKKSGKKLQDADEAPNDQGC